MKITNLLMTLALGTFFFLGSCSDDEADNGCTRCSVDIVTINCYVDVCEDGSSSSGGGIACSTYETAIEDLTTKEEKIAALEGLGCECK